MIVYIVSVNYRKSFVILVTILKSPENIVYFMIKGWKETIIALSIAGCASHQPPPGILNENSTPYLETVITKKDYPDLIDTRIIRYYKNTSIRPTRYEPTSVEIVIADRYQKVLKYYYDANASGSLLDHREDKLVRYAYHKGSITTMTYAYDLFTDKNGVTSYATSDPVERAAFDASRPTIKQEERNYKWLRNTVLPREQKKRHQQTYK